MLRFVLSALALGLTGMTAHAAVLPNASTAAGFQYYRSDWNGSSLYENKYGDGSAVLASQNLASAIVGLPYVYSAANPFGVVSAYSTIVGATNWNASGYSQIGYSVAVAGVSQDVIVPINYIARLRAEINGPNAIADANLYIASAYAGAQQYRSAKCSTSCVGYLPDLDITGVINTRGSSAVSVQLSASTGTYGYVGGTGTAFADPYFYIDPAFLAANPGATLQFSPFVGNDPIGSAVPEPATWAVMIAGYGLVGGAMRRRARVAVA